MIVLFAIVALTGPSIADLDTMVKAKDIAHISEYVDNLPAGFNPLQVIASNGAYENGKFGWEAKEMVSPADGTVYVVFSTPLTSEDSGEYLFARTGPKLHLIPEDDALGVKVDRHSFDVAFDTASKGVRITDDLTVTTKGDSDFFFRMSPEFQVSKIEGQGGVNVKFAQAGGVVVLRKPASGKTTLKIQYAATIDRPTYSASVEGKEATLANCYWYPMIARQPAPYDVTVHYPSEWKAIGQGVKTEDSPGLTKYRMDLPCVFYSLSVGPYKTGEYDSGSRKFYAWSPRLSVQDLETQAETYPAIIDFYERFAKFPFESYGGLDSPGYGGGALEAYSYATYGGGFPYMDPHEPSHTWWGGILDNTYMHSFWNESFAVYSENLFRRDWTGSAGSKLAFIPEGEVDPAYDIYACATCGADHGGAASTLGYGKGSHVLYMLEKLIGEESMLKSMRRFIKNQPVGKAAEWEDFEKAAEEENPGKNLESFFQDWLDRPGHVEPAAKVSYLDDSHEVEIDYQPKGKPFRIPLEVLAEYPDGKTQIQIFDVREAKTLKMAVRAKPTRISIDPYRFLIRPISEDEAPVQLSNRKAILKLYVDPTHPEWAPRRATGSPTMPNKADGNFFVASPEASPMIADLFQRVGFKVSGHSLTYKGKTIDLNHGAAEAIIDLGDGKLCGIGIGKTRIAPETGTAKVGIFDDLGRMQEGVVLPKVTGGLTFKL